MRRGTKDGQRLKKGKFSVGDGKKAIEQLLRISRGRDVVDNTLVSVNIDALRQDWLLLGQVDRYASSQYITNHPGQLRLSTFAVCK